ncbi:MAG: hypothetical protein RJA36_1819 [Pseudomonadota bacterium]|jgi:hypothetical protein
MNRLQSEWRRLYLAHDAPDLDTADASVGLIGPDGGVRALVLELARPADWNALAPLWQGVQLELELPAPAIAVNGHDGYQLWFSLAQAVPAARARDFLEALAQRYLPEVAATRLALLPEPDACAVGQYRHAAPVPRQQAGDHWSAFLAPDLAPMFSEDPWLDLPPSPDGQADLLARLASIPPAGFEQALERLGPAVPPPTPSTPPLPASALAQTASGDTAATDAGSPPAGHEQDPRRFLLGVMNDARVALELRIEAAKALLPYC